MIIAVDGPAASGKGTLARRLAQHLNMAYLDTGLLYRAVGWAVIQAGRDPADAEAAAQAAYALRPEGLDDPALRSVEAGKAASLVAAVPAVRAALLDFQRAFAAEPPSQRDGAVLDGRDIGTVVCPAAPVKLFVTASVTERARRRTKELQRSDPAISYDAVLADLKQRDARDSQRDVAPMVPAEDAILLDTTDLDIEAAFKHALALVEARQHGWNTA
ncbi:MAG: (d)CMP kinase [Rhodothalassiaceae bacterium]